jgi:hypothetical protein
MDGKLCTAILVMVLLVASCSPTDPTASPSVSAGAISVENCEFTSSQDAVVQVAILGERFRPASSWESMHNVLAVNSDGERTPVGANVVRPGTTDDFFRLGVHLVDQPTELIIVGLTVATGSGARVDGERGSDLVDVETDLGSASGTISRLETAPNGGVAIEVSLDADSLPRIRGWQPLGLDDVRIRQGSREWITQLNTWLPQEGGRITQVLGLIPQRSGELRLDRPVTLTTGGLAMQSTSETRLEWPQDCQP